MIRDKAPRAFSATTTTPETDSAQLSSWIEKSSSSRTTSWARSRKEPVSTRRHEGFPRRELLLNAHPSGNSVSPRHLFPGCTAQSQESLKNESLTATLTSAERRTTTEHDVLEHAFDGHGAVFIFSWARWSPRHLFFTPPTLVRALASFVGLL